MTKGHRTHASTSQKQKALEFFDSFIERLRPVVERSGETIESPLLFLELLSDWAAIRAALLKTYGENSCRRNFFFLTLSGLERDLPWRQVDFLSTRYALLSRNLRFIWEWSVRAYYVEYCIPLHRNPHAVSDPIHEKLAWLRDWERKFQWKDLFPVVFNHATLEQTFISDRAKEVWDSLNSFSHPSFSYQSKLEIHPELRTVDSCSVEWAKEVLEISVTVFDSIWCLVLSAFPNVRTALREEKGLFQRTSMTQSALGIT